jgi:hypothetical protein
VKDSQPRREGQRGECDLAPFLRGGALISHLEGENTRLHSPLFQEMLPTGVNNHFAQSSYEWLSFLSLLS